MTDWPAMASSRSPSAVTIRAICVLPPRREHADRIARPQRRRRDLAGEAAEVVVWSADQLHRHPQRLVPVFGAHVERHRVEMIE